jgi:hypothetical protein
MLHLALLTILMSQYAHATIMMQQESRQQELEQLWLTFKKTHNKIYASEEDNVYRSVHDQIRSCMF